jgi:D-psicose/D-tagatose/L-ribulose 3-epimerase
MKFGINTLLWTAGFGPEHISLFPRFRAMGFDGVEIARFAFDGFPAKSIGDKARSEGLQPILCSALTGQQSIITDDAAIRQQSVAFLQQGIACAAELGATTFLGPFLSAVGYLPGRRRTEDEWKRGIESLHQLTGTLDAHGVTLAIEPLNRFETFALNTMADGAALCAAVNHPRVGILYDTFHANIEEKNQASAIAQLGPHLRHFHSCENDRGIPGSGHVEWSQVFPALQKIGYDGWMVIESFGAAIPEIAAAACIWRDLAPSSDAIAADGVRFLREQARAHGLLR